MSVRIHQLSKDLGMENKELLELLKSRRFEVKSVSSTIDNISAGASRRIFSTEPAESSASEAASKEKEVVPAAHRSLVGLL